MDEESGFHHDARREVLLNIKSPEDMRAMCNTSREYKEICTDEQFWREKIRRDYGKNATYNIEELSSKETWIVLHRGMNLEFRMKYGWSWGVGDFTPTNDQKIQIREYIAKLMPTIIVKMRNKYGTRFYHYFEYDANFDSNILSISLYARWSKKPSFSAYELNHMFIHKLEKEYDVLFKRFEYDISPDRTKLIFTLDSDKPLAHVNPLTKYEKFISKRIKIVMSGGYIMKLDRD